MPNLVNYLDIQLRDMDYLGKYSSLEEKFFDPQGIYTQDNEYIKGYNDALDEAKKILRVPSGKKGKWTDSDFYQILQKQYERRLNRERDFIIAWKQQHKYKSIDFPNIKYPPSELSQMKNIKYLKDYAESFSNFIIAATKETDNILIKALRSEEMAKMVAGGVTSVVYSTNAVKRMIKNVTSSGGETQDLEHEMHNFYEQLFNVFFFGPRGGKVYDGQTPETMLSFFQKKDKNNEVIAKTIFEQRFRAFIEKYYNGIDEKQLDTFFASSELDSTIDKTFKNLLSGKNSSNSFTFKTFKKDNVRGVSQNTQTQLKKMLEETIRGILAANQMSYESFNNKMQGLIRVDEVFDQSENKYHKRVQVSIEKEKSKRKRRLELQQKLKNRAISSEEKMNALRLAYNDGIVSYDEVVRGVVDMRYSNRAFETEIRIKFTSLIIESLFKLPASFGIKDNISPNDIEDLRQVTFKKIGGSPKTGKILLNSLSAYGYEQIRGLLGEIATAYAGRISGIKNIQITGSDIDKLGMQKHYDIVMEISSQKFGFQVKNIKTAQGKSYTLYRTDLGLAQSAMYRYFSQRQVQTYRWLFANGKMLQNVSDGIKNVEKTILSNLITQIPEFLRIRNAAEKGDVEQMVDSDVYVIGNKYYPSSYLIYRAYQIVYNNFKNPGTKNKLFRLEGGFPNYGFKMDPMKDAKGNARTKPKYTTGRKYKGNQISEGDKPKNLVMLDKSHVLYGKKIIFSGVTITL